MKKGQSLLEVVIALALFAMGSAALFSLLMGQTTIVHTVERNARALASAEEGLEAVRAIRNSDWFALTDGTHGLSRAGAMWTLTPSPDTGNGITRTITVTSVDDTTKQVTASASWEAGSGRVRAVTLDTRLRDWRTIGQNGLSGDWTRPITLGTVDLGPGIQANGLAARNRIIYMVGSASSSAKPDFFVIDATDGAHPRVLGSVNTGRGLNEVAVGRNHAYAANRGDTNQLQIIDISNQAQPQLIANITPPGVGSDSDGLAMAINGATLYVGLDRNSGREFFIYDITNPASPVWRSSLEIDGDVNDIMIRGNYAYLASDNDESEFIIVDVRNPLAPTRIGAFDVPGGSEEGMGVDAHDDVGRTYLARTVGGNHATHHEFMIMNTSTVSAPALLGSLNLTSDVNAVRTIDTLSFLATSDSNNELKIYRTDNPSNITLWAQLNFPQVAADLDYERNILYAAVRSNDALRIITSSP